MGPRGHSGVPQFQHSFSLCVPPPSPFAAAFSPVGGEQALICNGCSQPVLSPDESISATFCMRMAWKRHPPGDGWRGPGCQPWGLPGALGISSAWRFCRECRPSLCERGVAPAQQGARADPGHPAPALVPLAGPAAAPAAARAAAGRVPRPLFGQDVTSTYLNSKSSSATLSLNLPQECGLLPGKLFLHGGFSLALCLRRAPTGTKAARRELLEHRPEKVRGVSPAPGCSCPAPPGTHQAGSSHGPGRSVPATPPGERLVVR